MSTKTSKQGAIPSRHRLFVPSTVRPPSRALKLTPFSLWKLPTGTTRLEFVTSGRSVAISSVGCGHFSARAAAAVSARNATRRCRPFADDRIDVIALQLSDHAGSELLHCEINHLARQLFRKGSRCLKTGRARVAFWCIVSGKTDGGGAP